MKGFGEFEVIFWDDVFNCIVDVFLSVKECLGGELIFLFFYGGFNGILL